MTQQQQPPHPSYVPQGHPNQNCGYCGYEAAGPSPHYCDGFGHAITTTGVVVTIGSCRFCRLGFCDIRWALEHPNGEPPRA